MKRRKPAYKRKTKNLSIRLSEAHRKLLETAADNLGLAVSSWALARLLEAARAELPENPKGQAKKK